MADNKDDKTGGINTFGVGNITAEQLASLKDAQSFMDAYTKAIEKNAEAGRSFLNALQEQDKKINATRASVGTLIDKSEEYKKNLADQISRLSEYSSILENKVNENLLTIVKTNEAVRSTTQTLNEIYGESTVRINNLEEAQKDYNETLSSGKYDGVAEALGEINKIIEEGTDLTKKEIEQIIEKNKLSSPQALKQFNEILEKQLNLRKLQSEELQKENEKLEKQNQEYIKEMSVADAEKLRTKNLENLNESIENLAQNLTSASSWMGMFKSAAMAAAAGTTNLSDAISKGFASAFNNPMIMLNLFLGILKTIGTFFYKFMIAPAFEFDKILAEVNKNTGGFRDEFEKIALIKEGPFSKTAIADLSVYGVELKELGAAYTALGNKINGFNLMTDQQRLLLSKNAATMENLGVASSTYAEMTSKFMGTIGKTTEGTRDSINLLARDAIAAGRSVGEYTKEFQQLMPQLVAYGREATQLFKELNSLAAMTKGVMSTGDLMQFSEQFSNWDSAAESVSKLNAALGGTSLNIADLMTADPTERLMQIKRAFDESGQDFDKLNSGYKKLLAEAFGGDVSKAASFFKGSLADANAEMSKMAASEKELEERKKKSIAAQEKLTKAIDSMRIAFTPIIDVITWLAEGIAKISEGMSPIVTFLTVSIPLGFIAFKLATMVIASTLRTAFTSVFSGILTQLSQVIGQLRVAKTEAAGLQNNLPGGGGLPGGGPPAPGGGMPGGSPQSKGMAGIGLGLAAIGLAAGLYNTYSTAKESSIKRMTAAESPNANAQAAAPASYDDGEEIIGPGQTKTLLVGGVPKAESSEKDTFIGAGAVNPAKLPTSTKDKTSVSQLINTNKNLMVASEMSSQRYAEKLSSANKEVKTALIESNQQIISSFKESIKEANNRPINVTVKPNVIAKLDPGDANKMYETAAEMGSERAFQAQNSKV